MCQACPIAQRYWVLHSRQGLPRWHFQASLPTQRSMHSPSQEMGHVQRTSVDLQSQGERGQRCANARIAQVWASCECGRRTHALTTGPRTCISQEWACDRRRWAPSTLQGLHAQKGSSADNRAAMLLVPAGLFMKQARASVHLSRRTWYLAPAPSGKGCNPNIYVGGTGVQATSAQVECIQSGSLYQAHLVGLQLKGQARGSSRQGADMNAAPMPAAAASGKVRRSDAACKGSQMGAPTRLSPWDGPRGAGQGAQGAHRCERISGRAGQ